jgi:CBS domain-containing protein
MKVRVDRCVLVAAPQGGRAESFEAVRERVAQVGPRAYFGHNALRHAQVECRAHEFIDGTTCGRCSHLLSAIPATDGRSVTVRCVFFESDPVTVLMTRSVDLVSADATEPVAIGAARMLDRGVEQLVVTSEGEAVGLLFARELDRPPPAGRERVGDHVAPLPVVPRSMTLAGLAAALQQEDLDCVTVIDGEELIGIVTRGDLRRTGVPGL